MTTKLISNQNQFQIEGLRSINQEQKTNCFSEELMSQCRIYREENSSSLNQDYLES